MEAQRVLNLDLRVAFTGLKIIRKFAAYLESEQKRVTLVLTLGMTRWLMLSKRVLRLLFFCMR